jgi:hypothetical protein
VLFGIDSMDALRDCNAQLLRLKGENMGTGLEIALAENNVLRYLLLELSDALIKRGVLSEHEVAGALLRTEWQSEVMDDLAEEAGDITRPHAEIAKLATEQWRQRLGLEPSLFALRKLQTEWLSAGLRGTSPLGTRQVFDAQREDEE